MSLLKALKNLFRPKYKPSVYTDDSKPENPEELEKLKPAVFELTPLETWRLNKFRDEHYHRHKNNKPGRSVLGIEIITTPTGIGTGTDVRCLDCGDTADITDYDCW